MTNPVARLGFFGALAVAGSVAALLLTFPPTAAAWDWRHPPAGYSTSAIETTSQDGRRCYAVTVNDQPFGNTCDADFQSRFDAYVDATICTVNPAEGEAAGMCGATTATVPDTSATTTDAAPTPATPATDTVAAVDTTATDTVDTATLEARIAALEAKYAELASRVDAIAKANDAAWSAFSAAWTSGATIADAALAARSAGLNALYGIG